MKMEQCSETSAHKILTPGNHPKRKNITFTTRRKLRSINIVPTCFSQSWPTSGEKKSVKRGEYIRLLYSPRSTYCRNNINTVLFYIILFTMLAFLLR